MNFILLIGTKNGEAYRGNIALKVQGKRKLLHTAESPEEFTIDKSLLEGDVDWEKLNEKFKNILI